VSLFETLTETETLSPPDHRSSNDRSRSADSSQRSIERERVDQLIDQVFGGEIHTQRVASLADGVDGVLHAAQFGVRFQLIVVILFLDKRELRNPVIKRKLSFGNDTVAGAKRYAQLLSVIRTLNRQGRSWRVWFMSLCRGHAESLLPQTV